MGCSFSTPVTKSNGVPTSGELAKATPSRATPKVPVPQAPPVSSDLFSRIARIQSQSLSLILKCYAIS